jgi:hypothetical protein
MPSIGALALRRLFKRRAIAGAQMFAMAVAIGVPLALKSVTTVAGNAGYVSAIDINSRDALVTIARRSTRGGGRLCDPAGGWTDQ